MDPLIAPGHAAPRSFDVAVIERARGGDRLAFESLIRDRADGLFRTAWAITGNEADAYDALQEACLSAWRNLPRLRDADRFDAWLGRVLTNSCRMLIRRRSRIREIPIDDDHDRADPRADHLMTEDADILARAFERLSADQRTILVLHHLRQEPVARIAEVLGIPQGTVKSRLHGARLALDRALERERR